MEDMKNTKVFRLVYPGKVDRLIAFANLPDNFTDGLEAVEPNGLGREWKRWLEEMGSIAKRTIGNPGSLQKEKAFPAFFALEYITVNRDVQRWQEIVGYVRRMTDPNVRLMDKLEDMAVPMAPDSHAPLTLEPEQVLVIELKPEKKEDETTPASISDTPAETIPTASVDAVAKRRGRPKKQEVKV